MPSLVRMTPSRRARSRLPLQQRGWAVVVGALMLLALIGPHTSWSVCLTGCCVPGTEVAMRSAVDGAPAAEGVAESCCCCSVNAATPQRDRSDDRPDVPDGPEPRNGNDSCHGCCIDLATQIDEGPLPQPVVPPDLETGTAAILPPAIAGVSSARAARHARFDTGPPRPAELLDRIATTVLRE